LFSTGWFQEQIRE